MLSASKFTIFYDNVAKKNKKYAIIDIFLYLCCQND